MPSASSLTFLSATSRLYISFSSSISYCFSFHQGKCQCAHFHAPLAWPAQGLCNVQTPAQARKAMERWRSRRGEQGEGRGINQDGPPTTAAGRLARHGEIICFPILGCWTLVTPAVSVKQGWSCKTHSASSRRGAAKGRATTPQQAPARWGAITPGMWHLGDIQTKGHQANKWRIYRVRRWTKVLKSTAIKGPTWYHSGEGKAEWKQREEVKSSRGLKSLLLNEGSSSTSTDPHSISSYHGSPRLYNLITLFPPPVGNSASIPACLPWKGCFVW